MLYPTQLEVLSVELSLSVKKTVRNIFLGVIALVLEKQLCEDLTSECLLERDKLNQRC